MLEPGPVSLSVEQGVAVIRIASPPVNALSAAVRAGLAASLAAAVADPAARAIVLAAEGRSFIAGADISEFGKPPVPPTLPEVVAAFDACAKPLVAAIQGAALGGGLELALACHARVAGPAAKLGLPEVKLGLVPGAGGTQRLPRLIGAAPALPLILEGTAVPAAEALRLGLVDEVAEGDLLAAAKRRALALDGAPLPRLRDRPEGLGAFHAEVIDKVGPLVGRMTYGVRADTARALFVRGLELHPDSPTGLIEHARALLVLEGDERLAEATRLYERAAALEPQDARERLDVELARAGLRD